MRHDSLHGFSLTLAVCLATLGVTLTGQSSTTEMGDGLVRSELTLDARGIAVAYDPELSAEDAASLLNGPLDTATRVARLEGHPALRIGSLEPRIEPDPEPSDDTARDDAERDDAETDESEDDDPEAVEPYHDLWLTRVAGAWALDARPGASTDLERATIPLEHRVAESSSPVFSASLIPTGDAEGRLELQWGSHRWVTPFELVDLPPRPRPVRREGRSPGQDLTRDSDTDAIARANVLSERNESVLTRPDGSRLSVLFWKELAVDGPDYADLASATDRPVVQLTRAAALKLKTDVPLRFGTVTIETGNLDPGFAGLYALWLKRVGDGWRLVFNHEPDSWGSQHDPDFDAAEIELAYARRDGSERPLAVTIQPTGDDQGRIVLHWGPHEWSADFSLDAEPR